MPKRKRPITDAGYLAPNSSSTPRSSRALIRQFHILLKRQAQLKSQQQDVATASALVDVEREIEKLGGLGAYQRMSAIGQGNDRGGGSERVLIGWLMDMSVSNREGKGKLRLLEVGALKPDNYRSCTSWIESTPVDLQSRHPSIKEQDFLLMDDQIEHFEKWNVISLSLVLNFVPKPKDRGRMLSLAYNMLSLGGFLFLALPLPCVENSRYLTISHLSALMQAINFTEVKKKWKSGGKMAYWLYQKTAENPSVPTASDQFKKKYALRQVPAAITLPQDWMSKLSIIHWNDVYRVQPQKISPTSSETIDVTQFAALLDGIREQWTQRPDGKRDGLVLFSGDVFSPSVESSVTRGSHMVPVMNEIGPDVSLTGYPHLSKLIQDTTFPWLLSNIIDSTTARVPEYLHEFQVLDRAGIRIGVIGLVEKEWIGTVSSWPQNFEYRDMATVGKDLSERLRDPDGEYKCDLIIALTHARIPNDILLAKSLFALSPSEQLVTPIASLHGVDLLLGGHDHLYYVSKGVTAWEDFDVTKTVLGAEGDLGDVLVIKSGTDFRDLSEFTLELDDTPSMSVRRKVIKGIRGRRHTTKPNSKSSEALAIILKRLLSSVSDALRVPVCKTTVEINVRSELIRTTESAAGNWFADIIRHSYDDALCMKEYGASDGVLICAGTLRGDSVYGPGNVTLGDILEILPFEDPVVVLEMDGEAIWAALEASLETWPAQEGRFPVISGLRVSWDSCRPPGQRVLGIWLLTEVSENMDDLGSGDGCILIRLVDGPAIEREKGGRKYKIVTREYMAQGHDGFLPLKGCRYLIDDENGQMMSTLVRKYLLGSRFVNKMVRLADHSATKSLQPSTRMVISREVARRERNRMAAHHWKHFAHLAVNWSRSKAHYQDQINVCTREHMSSVDSYDGQANRRGRPSKDSEDRTDDDHLVVTPAVDGRLKDEAQMR